MGGIPPLLRLLGSDTPLVTGPGLVDLTTAVLAYLTAGSSENVAVIIEAGGIKVLVGLLEGGRCRGVVAEVVASMLRNVARHGPDACACIRASGALPLLVLLVRGVLGPDAVASALQALMVVSEEDKASCSLIQEAGGIQVGSRSPV